MQKRTSFSIIIPTFHEVQNLPYLLSAIHDIPWGNRDFEVIVVDDNSQDGTKFLMKALSHRYPNSRLIVRQSERSLSQSVLDGFQAARHPLLVTLDADLSHPVSAIPKMLEMLEEEETHMVIGSRYVAGGSVDPAWPIRRKMLSLICAWITQYTLRVPVKDPLSGFFAIKRSVFNAEQLNNAAGWKIALEIMIKCQCQCIKEIPIHFAERKYGMGKLNFKIGLTFAKQLRSLAFYQIRNYYNKAPS